MAHQSVCRKPKMAARLPRRLVDHRLVDRHLAQVNPEVARPGVLVDSRRSP